MPPTKNIELLRALYGFDKSIFQQRLIWGKSVLCGALGVSISLRQSVTTLIADRLPATLELVLLACLIGGTVLIERLFSCPGIGSMVISAILDRDLPLTQGLVLTFALMFIVINLLIDLSYGWLNPRMRQLD